MSEDWSFLLWIQLTETLAKSKITSLVKFLDLCASQTWMPSAQVCEKDSFLSGQNYLMLSILSLLHWYNITTSISQILWEQDLSVWDSDQVKEATELAAENRIWIDLQHTEDMLPKFNLQSDEVVDRIKP